MPRLEDYPAERVPYVERLDRTSMFIYFSRLWFMEGAGGENGRTSAIIYTQSKAHECRVFGCINHWVQNNERQPIKHQVWFDDPISCKEMYRIATKLVRGGALEIATPEESCGFGHVDDLFGIRAGDQRENWYSVTGGSHPDRRHHKYILPLFLKGRYGLPPHI